LTWLFNSLFEVRGLICWGGGCQRAWPYGLSEELHATYITLPAIWGALQAFFLAGLIMIAIGTILIARLEKNVRRRNVKPKARVPSGLNFYKYGTA